VTPILLWFLFWGWLGSSPSQICCNWRASCVACGSITPKRIQNKSPTQTKVLEGSAVTVHTHQRWAHLVSTDTHRREIAGKPNRDAAPPTHAAACYFVLPCGADAENARCFQESLWHCSHLWYPDSKTAQSTAPSALGTKCKEAMRLSKQSWSDENGDRRLWCRSLYPRRTAEQFETPIPRLLQLTGVMIIWRLMMPASTIQ